MINKEKFLKKRILIPSVIVGLLLILLVSASLYALKFQSTDDAFVEGRLVSVAPRVSGQVTALYVDDNDFVKKGDLLLEIDANDYQNKVDELESALLEAKANKNISFNDTEKSESALAEVNESLDFAKKDYERYSKLIKEGLCTKQEYDNAQSVYKQALKRQHAMNSALNSSVAKNEASQANIQKIEAQLAQAKLNLSYTKIYAPQDGNIASRNVEAGNYLNTAQPILDIVSPEIWIVANFKETQLTHMKKGQEVQIKIDTYPGKKFKGQVDSIQKASGAKASLFPPENAVGSYIKVVQRIPVKIKFTEDISDYQIAPGMSVIPKVKIR